MPTSMTQKVVVNIGSKSVSKKKGRKPGPPAKNNRKMLPDSHMQNPKVFAMYSPWGSQEITTGNQFPQRLVNTLNEKLVAHMNAGVAAEKRLFEQMAKLHEEHIKLKEQFLRKQEAAFSGMGTQTEPQPHKRYAEAGAQHSPSGFAQAGPSRDTQTPRYEAPGYSHSPNKIPRRDGQERSPYPLRNRKRARDEDAMDVDG